MHALFAVGFLFAYQKWSGHSLTSLYGSFAYAVILGPAESATLWFTVIYVPMMFN